MKMILESALRFFLYVVVAYAIFVSFVYFTQRRMLYLPDIHNLPSDRVESLGLRFWPERSSEYRGFISLMNITNSKGTVIVFQGNAGAAWDRYFYVKALEPLGYQVVLAEYPGYGDRPGTHSEKHFVEDAEKTIKAAYDEFGGPVYLWGESLGAGVVTAVVSDISVPVAGVMLTTPWDSLPELAQRHYPYLPARWLLKDKYDNIRNLKGFPGPVAVLMAESDEIVPSQHTTTLYGALNTRKRLWIFNNAGHNSWPTAADLSWWAEVMDFISAPGN